MGSISTRSDIFKRQAQGYGVVSPFLLTGPGATTAAAAASGSISVKLLMNSLGTTYQGTLIPLQLPAGLTGPLRTVHSIGGCTSGRTVYLGIAYKMGTLDLTATGDKFTADSATFPVTRTVFGAATTAVNLLPVLVVTTATTVTAPVIILKKSDGSAGYTNQAGSTVVGTRSMTFPANATALSSAFLLPLEFGDSAVQKITNIQVTTAATAGAATIYGVEMFSAAFTSVNSSPAEGTAIDSVFSGLAMDDIKPAVATSGTATTYLVGVSLNANSESNLPCTGVFSTVLDS